MPCKNTGRFFWLLTLSAGDFSAFSFPLPAAATLLSGVRAATTSSQLCVRPHANGNIWPPGKQPLPNHRCCAFPLGNRWWNRMGARNRLPAGPHWGCPLKNSLSHFPSLSLDFSSVSHFKTKCIFWGGRLGGIHFTSFCHSKQHSKLKSYWGRCC